MARCSGGRTDIIRSCLYLLMRPIRALIDRSSSRSLEIFSLTMEAMRFFLMPWKRLMFSYTEIILTLASSLSCFT